MIQKILAISSSAIIVGGSISPTLTQTKKDFNLKKQNDNIDFELLTKSLDSLLESLESSNISHSNLNAFKTKIFSIVNDLKQNKITIYDLQNQNLKLKSKLGKELHPKKHKKLKSTLFKEKLFKTNIDTKNIQEVISQLRKWHISMTTIATAASVAAAGFGAILWFGWAAACTTIGVVTTTLAIKLSEGINNLEKQVNKEYIYKGTSEFKKLMYYLKNLLKRPLGRVKDVVNIASWALPGMLGAIISVVDGIYSWLDYMIVTLLNEITIK